MVCAGRGKGELLSNGYRVSAWDDKKIPGDGQWGWLHDNVNGCDATELDI